MKKKCPRCGGEARHSHHHGLFQKTILQLIRIHPFHCRDCGNRFFRFSAHRTHHKDQTGSPADFGQPPKRNGQFKEIISQMHQKEGKLGLGKQEHGLGDELRRLHERAKQEGLAADHADSTRINADKARVN